MRASDRRALLAVAAAAALSCSTRVLRPIDPDPCAGGDIVDCAPPGLLDDLIGYWRFEDGAGSMTAKDVSGRGNDGTLHQLDPATAWVAGRGGGGLDVSARGWVGVPRSDTIDLIRDALTLSAWIYFDGTIMPDPGSTTVGWGTAISREKGATVDQHYHLSLNLEARPALFVIPATGGVTITAPSPVARATWVHLAATYDGAEAKLFVDGSIAARARVTGTLATDSTPVIIGGNGNDASGVPTELFPGRLDEIMLYRRALSDGEVGQLAAGVLFPGGAPRDAGAAD